MGLKEPGLDRLIRAGYQLLDLSPISPSGPKEARAWTITRGTKAPQAAGVIHTDFEKGFIRAETIAYDDYVAWRRERRKGCRENAARGQGVRRQGRRRDALPLRDLAAARRFAMFGEVVIPGPAKGRSPESITPDGAGSA